MQVKNKDYWLVQGNCLDRFKLIPDGKIHLTVTSPPYDQLRSYQGNGSQWNENVWKKILEELYRITCAGGVVVWVVGDATINGSESGTSFKQALYAMQCGFNLHDTMIYHKNGLPKNHNRYEQDFEYMFVFTKGKPRVFNPIRVPTKFPEKEGARKNSFYSVTDEKMRSARSGKKRKPVGDSKIKGNIWYYAVGKGHSTLDTEAFKHPAIFPEKLVADHIKSWSNEGDIIFDPFSGSGTTGKMALLALRRFIGFELNKTYFIISKNRIGSAYNDMKNLLDLRRIKPIKPSVNAVKDSLKYLNLANLLWIFEHCPNKFNKLLDSRSLQTLMTAQRKADRKIMISLLKTFAKYSDLSQDLKKKLLKL